MSLQPMTSIDSLSGESDPTFPRRSSDSTLCDDAAMMGNTDEVGSSMSAITSQYSSMTKESNSSSPPDENNYYTKPGTMSIPSDLSITSNLIEGQNSELALDSLTPDGAPIYTGNPTPSSVNSNEVKQISTHSPLQDSVFHSISNPSHSLSDRPSTREPTGQSYSLGTSRPASPTYCAATTIPARHSTAISSTSSSN